MLQANAVAASAISVRGVHKTFKGRDILHDVNLEVRRGELLGLLGPNGAGKTTLMKMMATLTIPDRGTIEVDGIDVEKDPLLVRSRIGLCGSDDRSFYFRLTARENLTFFGALAGLRGRRLQRGIQKALRDVSLSDAIDRRFGDFSSGMRQRMMVARALLSDPDILFFDEPTRAVDPNSRRRTAQDAARTNSVERRGKTIVLATNLLEEAWAICDRVAVVSNGTIAAVAPPSELGGEKVTALHSSPIELFKAITSYGC